jgi:hypothetical protein
MKSGIRNLLLASCFLFAVSYDCYTPGADYDRRDGLYPESGGYSRMFRKAYGERWRKLGSATFFLGATLTVAACFVWRREEQNGNKSLSILI